MNYVLVVSYANAQTKGAHLVSLGIKVPDGMTPRAFRKQLEDGAAKACRGQKYITADAFDTYRDLVMGSCDQVYHNDQGQICPSSFTYDTATGQCMAFFKQNGQTCYPRYYGQLSDNSLSENFALPLPKQVRRLAKKQYHIACHAAAEMTPLVQLQPK